MPFSVVYESAVCLCVDDSWFDKSIRKLAANIYSFIVRVKEISICKKVRPVEFQQDQ